MAAVFLAAVAAAEVRQPAPAREPASKAAAILTWPVAKRELYIAALDTFFLTRTVKAGPHPHPLDPGRPLAAFETGGSRADYFSKFLSTERVRGVLVLQDGKIRLERYVSPDSPTTRWNSFSVSKSITSTLVGAAMKDGFIKSLDDPVTRYIKELRGSAYDVVNVRQLLTMTSGVKWDENYTDPNSDVARMYAQAPDPGFDMTTSYVRRLPREAPPGTKWVYKTSETNLVGVLVADATGKKLADYLTEKIWRPYGMERDAEWMIDDVGDEQGGCCLAVTLRDYGRFGQFILDGARIDGKSIVTDGWLPEATRSQVSLGQGSGYGYQWWTRDDGTFEGRGIYGQTLHIDRARHLVIVINSATEQPTGRESGQARQDFIAAVNAEVDAQRAPATPVKAADDCPAGKTEVRPGSCQAPSMPPPSIVDYRPHSTLVTAAHPVPRAKYPAIDFHGHPQNRITSAPALATMVSELDQLNVGLMVAADNLSGERLRQAVATIAGSPQKDRVRVLAGIDFRDVGEGWAAKAVRQLEDDVKAGAVGVGEIPKSLGLSITKRDGSRLKIDDPDLDAIWDACARLNLPVFIHTADPQEFFAPIDNHNERWLELALFPQRRYPADRFPSFEELMTERDNLFKRHPRTTFVAAHMGWHANDLPRLGRMFDAMPNLYAELGAVLYDIGRQPRAAHDFFVKYQDRILFGKDAYEPSEYPYYWRVFETNDDYFDYYRDYHAFWKLYGIGLPDPVLRKVYYENALKLASRLPRGAWPQ